MPAGIFLDDGIGVELDKSVAGYMRIMHTGWYRFSRYVSSERFLILIKRNNGLVSRFYPEMFSVSAYPAIDTENKVTGIHVFTAPTVAVPDFASGYLLPIGSDPTSLAINLDVLIDEGEEIYVFRTDWLEQLSPMFLIYLGRELPRFSVSQIGDGN